MKITLEIPDRLAEGQALAEVDWLKEVAVALFQQELVTLGTASKIAGMPQLAFQSLLYDRGIGPHYDLADYRADIESLRANNWR